LSTIRPQLPPQAPPPQAPRLTGQSALFALARAKMAEPAQPVAAPQPTAPAKAATAAAADAPQRLLRPGSLLDIRV
jgi:hypothetical protein